MILTFFLQYFNCFGEVIFSPLIYFNVKYFSGEKIIKTKILVSKFDKRIKYENREIPNSLRGSLSCLGFRGLRNGKAIKLRIKFLFDFNIYPPTFLYFGEIILSPLFYFQYEIFGEKNN